MNVTPVLKKLPKITVINDKTSSYRKSKDIKNVNCEV